MLPSIMQECKKCNKMTEGNVVPKGNQIGLYCSHCGSWIKWLPHTDYRVAQIKKENLIYHCYSMKRNCEYADKTGECTLTIKGARCEYRQQQDNSPDVILPNELTINGVIYVKKEK